ncbi:hypothetical protein GCM10010392_19230 [Streptomyces clavifer]|nr:hypothetical protein GCM10010392_19230 [Streptomyces clavifer]
MTSPDLRAADEGGRRGPPRLTLRADLSVTGSMDTGTDEWPSPRGRGREEEPGSYLQIGSIVIKVNAPQVGAQSGMRDRSVSGSAGDAVVTRAGGGTVGRTSGQGA